MAYDPTVLGGNAKINPYDNTSSIVLPSLTNIINYLIGNPPPSPPFAGTILFNYKAGLILANDGGTPTTVLDISAGLCSDSTNVVYISLSAFTKSIGGAWVAGSGNNGLGTGINLTPLLGTFPWLHVFAIVNSGVSDVYFDTDVGAANKPAGTTAFRRIGSAQLDVNNHFILFTQTGNTILLTTAAAQGGTVGTGAGQLFGLSTPTGVKVMALMRVTVSNAAANVDVLITSPDEGDNPPDVNSGYVTARNPLAATRMPAGHVQVMTNTSNQVRARASAATTSMGISTYGWIDFF